MSAPAELYLNESGSARGGALMIVDHLSDAPAVAVADHLTAAVSSIGDILALAPRIPEYQRPYKWEPRHVGQLIDDIWEFQSADHYRVGTMILHVDNGVREIVDGQQRYLTCVLLARALAERARAERAPRDPGEAHADTGLEELLLSLPLDSVQVSPFGVDISRRNLVANDAYIRRVVGRWASAEWRVFADLLLRRCEVVTVTIDKLDAAFQMFDSQNTRGRALYPTDLLKAFHIREMSSDHVSESLKLEMVRLWEDIPPAHINRLFSDYLFQIKRWASGRSVPEQGFADADIELFKGIRESDAANRDAGWPKSFLYAKNFTDDFRQENATLLRYNALSAMQYPHQIDQPVINGETFFQMVSHYSAMGEQLGIFAEGHRANLDGTEWQNALLAAGAQVDAGDARLVRVRNLFECLLMYYSDRFGFTAGESDRAHSSAAAHLFLQYACALRVDLAALRQLSVDNYALGTLKKDDNLFREIREATKGSEITRRGVPRPGEVDPNSRVAQLRNALMDALWREEMKASDV